MDKRLNITLAVQADTTRAKAQMRELNQTLTQTLSSKSTQNFLPGMNEKLAEARMAATQLQASLQNAFNIDTGKLNLTKLNQSLKASGKDLNYYRQQFQALGPEGARAFSQVTQSIMTADVRIKTSIGLIQKMKRSLANVAQYLISTNILRGMTSAITSAYQYAQDLNESLNNIRIVTNKSADDMAKFAIQANKAAKALSTTTTAYTNASLIYYQQGNLTDKEITERTNATIKLANVTGQSVEQVSDQLTAIWNNFDDGVTSLEYYADVITALGAATASSSDEIAQGLEKFAAVAETVGLSYEYATAALATVTAQTRQSADVVGTAFKTLFARIQDLELGKTLDDGISLGKYSQALSAIGVSVLDANGQLKDMDKILDDMGRKWDTLTAAQKTATAQTVAGVRQYTQLISLMDNWDKFKDNVNVATDAEGTLQKQADVYAESWEGANKRVKASAESIYQALLDDKFFIKLTNGFADFLDGLKTVIDNIGGLQGVLLTLGAVISRIFGPQVLMSFKTGLANTLEPIFHFQERANRNLQNQASQSSNDETYRTLGMPNENSAQAVKNTARLEAKRTGLTNLSPDDQSMISIGMEQVHEAKDNVIKAGEQEQEARANYKKFAKQQAETLGVDFNQDESFQRMNETRGQVRTVANNFATLHQQPVTEGNFEVQKDFASKALASMKTEDDQWNVGTQKLFEGNDQLQSKLENFETMLKNNKLTIEEYQQALNDLFLDMAGDPALKAQDSIFDEWAKDADILKAQTDEAKQTLQDLKKIESEQSSNLAGKKKDLSAGKTLKKEQEKKVAELKKQQEEALKAENDAKNNLENKRIIAEKAQAGDRTLSSKEKHDAPHNLQKADSQYEEARAKTLSITKELEEAERSLVSIRNEVDQQQEAVIAGEKQLQETRRLVTEAAKDGVETSNELTAAAKQNAEEYDEVTESTGKSTAAMHDFNSKGATVGHMMDQAGDKSLITAEKISQMASTFMMVGASITSVKSMFATLNDETATFGDKLSSVLTTLGMMIPAVMSIRSVFDKETKTKIINTAATLANAAAEKKLNQEKGVTQPKVGERIKAFGKDTKKKVKDSVKKTGQSIKNKFDSYNQSVFDGLSDEGKQYYTNKVETKLTKKGFTKGADGNWTKTLKGGKVKSVSGSKVASKAASSAGASSMGSMAAGGALIAAGVAVAAVAIKAGIDQYNKYSNAAKKAAEQAEQAAQAYEETAQAFESFKQGISDYSEAKDGLKSLTEGTEEYREALLKANEQAMELIKQHDGLQYKIDEKGIIKIDEQSLEDAQKKKLDDMQLAQRNSMVASQNAKQAQTKSDMVDFQRKKLKSGEGFLRNVGNVAAATAAGAGSGALIGAGVGTIVPGWGTAIGAGIGALAGAVTGLTTGITAVVNAGSAAEQEEKALEDLAQVFEKEGNAKFADDAQFEQLLRTELKIKDENLIKSLVENRESTLELVSTMAENNSALKRSIEATAKANNLNNSSFTRLTSSEQSLASKIIANRAADVMEDKDSDEYKEAKKKAEEQYKKDVGTKKGFFEENGDDDTYNKYMEITYGADWKDNYRVTDRGGTHATIQKKDENGKWVTQGEKDGLSNKTVEEAITDYYIQQYGDSDKQTLQELVGLGDLLNKTVTGIDKDAVFDIQSALASGEGVDLSLMSPEQIEQLKGQINYIGQEFGDTYSKSIKAAIDNYSVEAYNIRMEKEASNIISSGAQELGVTTGALESYTQELMKNNAALAGNKKLAAETAVETFRFSKALEKLEDVVKDNMKNIKKAEKNNLEYYESLGQVKKALEETFGLSLSADFVSEKNIDLIAKASEGNQEAIKQLGLSISKDYVENLKISEEIINKFSSEDFKPNEGLIIGDQVFSSLDEYVNYFNKNKNAVLGYIDEISKASLGVGDNLTTAMGPEKTKDFIAGLNSMAIATEMTVDEMKATLANAGIEAKVEQQWIPKKIKVPKYKTYEKPGEDENGKFTETYTYQTGEEEVEGGQYVASISYDDSFPNTQVKYSGPKSTLSTPSTRSSGSSGSSNKSFGKKDKKETKVYREEFDMYRDSTEALKEQEDELKKIQKLKDNLWGPARIKAIGKEIDQYKKLMVTQQDYIDQISGEDGMLSQDQAALEKIGGIFNAEGKLLNYDELTRKWTNEYNEAVNTYNSTMEAATNKYNSSYKEDDDEDVYDKTKEKAEENLEDAEKQLENNKKILDQWKTTKELSEEAKEKFEEYAEMVKDLAYEEIISKIDFKIELNERELKKIDHQLKMMGNDFYKMAEIMATTSTKKDLYNEKGMYNTLDTGLTELENAYANGDITYDKYIEGLRKLEDQSYASKEALFDLNEQMLSYYETAITEGQELFSRKMGGFDNLLSTLDHYKNTMSLIGREKDYDSMNELLEGRIDVLNDKVSATKAFLDSYDDQIADVEKKIASTSGEDKKYWQERLQTLNEMKAAEQQNLYSYLEEIGAAANEILSNSIEQAFEEAEKAMTNGMSFDAITKDMERMNTLSDQYLTNTNKMYETNKLISQAQLAMDKTTNVQAKQRYKDYVDYITQLQESGNLNKQQLAIAEAKYKVLEAEMALEEAKDAKSVVRLTRDSEGNFGYVYTADQDAVSGAEQNYADAQNELYNVGLEGTKEYQEKIIQTQQQTLEELKQLEIDFRVNHLISEEEYNQQKAHIMEVSNETLMAYQEAFAASQYVLATESYGELEDNDALYYNGVKGLASETQADMKTNLDNFGAGMLDIEQANYLKLQGEDSKYYGGLIDLAKGTITSLDGLFNGDEGSAKKVLDNFKTNLETSLDKCKTATEGWQKLMKPLVDNVGLSFDDSKNDGLKQKIDKVTESSSDLEEEITGSGGLIEGIDDLWTSVGEQTTQWQNHWKELDTVIGKYDNLLKRIAKASGAKPPEFPEEDDDDDTTTGGGADDEETETEKPDGITPITPITPTTPTTTTTTTTTTDIKENHGGWTSYEDAMAAGYKNAMTKDEFNRRDSMIKQYGNYQNYLDDLYFTHTNGALNGGYGTVHTISDIVKDHNGNKMFVVNHKVYDVRAVNGGKGEIGDKATFISKEAFQNGKDILKTYSSTGNYYSYASEPSVETYDGVQYARFGKEKVLYLLSDVVKQENGRYKINSGVAQYKTFNTGGYTGEWGPDGKLAVLHQKELVLNAEDTENILNTVSFVRDLISSIDSNAMMSSLRDLFAYTATNNFGSNVEQDIKIYAEFPSATNHSEIEEAFNNLLNTASQYANRKN